MTQIKLRRDTSSAFASSNPILGNGEPAYETDTKKLKIGDGTTAYTQLEYFTAGGGGSTNITATLPLKIVDGVISLEVDGQTIQIVDGKLHANLDELGNEVNDLSGRVTAAEADILTKENKITTTGALSLQEKIKSNAVGFTITSESAMTNDHYQRVPFPESQSSRLYIQDASFTYPYKSYLTIPYSLGQVIRVPRAYGQLFFGSFDDNGDFIVSVGFNTFYYGTSGFALFGGPIYRAVAGSSEYPPVMPKLNPTQMGYDGNYTYKTPPREAADSGDLYGLSNYLPENDFSCAFYQISPDTTGAIMIQAFWSINNGRCSTAVYRDTETSYQYAGHLDAMRNNIQYALWLPNETGTSYNPSKFGLYDWNVSRIPWGNDDGWEAFFKGRGPNLYSLTGQSSKNYLELNLGDGLSVVDGKLTSTGLTAIPTASANTLGGIKVGDNLSITEDGTLSATGGGSAPTNMVTTDTSQDITGLKSFTTGKTTFKNTDSNRKILGEINSNGFYCNYYIDKASGEKPCYLGKVAEKVFNMGIPELTRVTGRIFANTLTKWDGYDEVGTILDSSNLGSYVDGTTITYTNNKLSATGGGSAPTNMVTTDTAQTITGTKTFNTKIYAPNIILSDEFTQSRITSSRSDTFSKLQISRPDNTDEYFEIGRSHNMKTCYIKPCEGDTALVINNYGDGDATSVPAPNVKIYGNVTDGSGNKFLTSGDKETIMGYMTPDFDSGINVPLNEEYICPYSGYFILQANSTGNMARAELFVYKSDGSFFNAFQCAPNYGGGTDSGAFVAIQLSKGTKIKATIPTASKSHYSILFPFKGGLNNA